MKFAFEKLPCDTGWILHLGWWAIWYAKDNKGFIMHFLGPPFRCRVLATWRLDK